MQRFISRFASLEIPLFIRIPIVVPILFPYFAAGRRTLLLFLGSFRRGRLMRSADRRPLVRVEEGNFCVTLAREMLIYTK